MNRHYNAFSDADWFYPMTVFDETGVAGHLIMRFTDEKKTVLRFNITAFLQGALPISRAIKTAGKKFHSRFAIQYPLLIKYLFSIFFHYALPFC